MTLEELKSEVYLLTARPDLEDQTLQAIRAATLKMHQRDYWRRDLKEVGVQFDTAAYLQSFDIYEFVPKFRSLAYVRKYLDKLFEVIEPEALFNGFGNEKTNVVYLAGNILQMRSSEPFTQFLLGYYQYPDVTVDGWNSWIADEFPYAIIYEAATTIAVSIGYQEIAASLASRAREEFLIMQRTAIRAEGL